MEILAESAVRVTLLTAAVGGVLAALRIRSPRAAHVAWCGVAIAMLLMPLMVAWGPEAAVPVLPGRQRLLSSTGAPSTAVDERRGVMPPPAKRPTASPDWNWQRPALLAYGAIASLLVLRIVIGLRHASRLQAEAIVIDGRLTHPCCSTPITVGLWSPAIVLPPDWVDWPPSELAAVVAHEREHMRWRDPLMAFLTLAVRAIFWFHPLAWWMHRRVATLAEEACDAAVLAQGHDRQGYAALLLKFARSLSVAGGRIAVRGTMMAGNGLEARLRMLEQPQRPVSTRPRLLVAGVACAAAVVLASAATPTNAAAPFRGAPVPAPLAQNGARWLSSSSEHFDIYFMAPQAGRVGDLTYEAERAYIDLSADMKYDLNDRVRLVLVDRERDIQNAQHWTADITRSARWTASVIVISTESLDGQPGILLHELTHSFVLQIAPEATRVAPGLIEGLADHQRGVWTTGAVRGVREAIGSAWMPRLEDIGHADRFWSHAMFDFVADRYGREGIRRCLFVLRSRPRLAEAVPVAFGTSMEAFEQEFRAYLTARFGER
jgi:hypothetical protein